MPISAYLYICRMRENNAVSRTTFAVNGLQVLPCRLQGFRIGEI